MAYKTGMLRCIALALFFILSVPVGAGADTPVAVTITKRTPIETLSPDGRVVGVSEATVGTRLNLVGSEGSQLTLQDAQGIRYRIASSSTDYNPVIAVSSTATNGAPQIPAPVVVTNAVVAPAKPINPTPSAPDKSSTVAASQDKPAPLADSPVFTVKIEGKETANEMCVWPEGGLSDRPLLIAAHGNGGSGPKEIKGWLRIAKEHRFTIVCPSFHSSYS
jgi:hypothetical protein